MNKRQWRAWAKRFTAQSGEKPKAAKPIGFSAMEEGGPLEILIYDQIGDSWFEDSVSARDFAVALAAVPHDREIVVRINSPGGNVWDGWAIYNLLAARRDHVVCVVDGIAASIASVIALAGRECRMSEASMLMIHNSSGLCVGNSEDMKETAAALDKIDATLAGIYANKTGKPIDEIKAAMTAETWFTSAEAEEFGLCDALHEPDEPDEDDQDDKPSARRVPQAASQTKPIPAGANSGGGAIQKAMNRTEVIALLNKLGVKFEDTDTDAQLVALVASYTPPAPSALVAAQPSVTDEVNRQLRVRAAVQTAADELRIPAAQVADWTTRALKDETLLATLQAMPPRAVGASPIDSGASGNQNEKTMRHAEFEAMSHNERNAFIRSGGKITN